MLKFKVPLVKLLVSSLGVKMRKLKEIKDKLDNNKALYISWKVVKIIFSIFLFIA